MTVRHPGFATARVKQREKTREHVIETALGLFAKQGYVGVRVEDIAAEAGISRATFYKYFSEREEILVELFARLLGGEPVPAPPGSPAESLDRIRDLLIETAKAMVAKTELARFVYSLPIRHSALVGTGSRPQVLITVESLLNEGVQAGVVRDDIPVSVVTGHVGRAFEAAMRDWAEGRTDDAAGQVRLLLGLALDGVRPLRT